jgi:carboxyl-terminal processing protease
MLFDRWVLMAYVPSDQVSDFRLMAEAWNTINRYYVDRPAVKPEALTYGAINGMVDALGDTGHSVFLTPAMVKQLHVTERGRLKGVGVQVQMNTNRQVVILAPIDNSPAQHAGLRSGEIIMSIDGRDIEGLPLDQVASEITGPVGTSVDLGIFNPKTQRSHTVRIIRADVRIAAFDDHMSEDLRTALTEIQRQQIQGIVLDMRNNPGGVLDEAVEVASQFLGSGNVLLVKDAQGSITSIPVHPGGVATNLPMAVLINGGTASAAEIVAGALRDARRAILIGETSFGTGTVLNEFSLQGGSAMLLAVDEWLTPSGESFWHKGISPEITVALDTDPLYPVVVGDMTAEEFQGSNDKQLLRALAEVQKLIKSPSH